ncbi:uncharacterized protein LOC141598780 isoform X2 [Silene latifolia]|uniref:uncharacterized protein LOC141598780 isoform X2 n=1 Tax=Silene latifolia TaxID=37657 RepID=UPI003D76B1B0
MEDLLKQVRSKFKGQEEIGSFREGRTPSFRGEKKPQNWLKRQMSRQMSFTHSIEEAEYAAAVAAAAFAVTELDSYAVDQRKPEPERRASLPRIISGFISSAFSAEPEESPKIYADENDHEATRMIPEKTIHPVPSIKRTPTTPRKRLTFADELAEDPGKPSSTYGTPLFGEEEWKEVERMRTNSTPSFRTPSIRKNPSFGEIESEDVQKKKPFSIPSFRKTPTVRKTPSFDEESMEETRTMRSPKRPALQPIFPPPIPPPPAVPPLKIYPEVPPKRAQKPRDQEYDADAWEREEMDKIKQRYEKLNATILEWEDKKKKKARRKLEMTERDPDKKRVKAMHNYQLEMERIKQIADGARAQAKGKQRNEEMKVREKASRYRATGEPPLPPMCLCL